MIGFKHLGLGIVVAVSVLVLALTGAASPDEDKAPNGPTSAHCHCVISGPLLCGTEITPRNHQVFALTDIVILSDRSSVIHFDDAMTTKVAFTTSGAASPTLALSFRTPFIFSTNLTIVCDANYDETTEVTADGLLIPQPR
jgi:hypothetical protein